MRAVWIAVNVSPFMNLSAKLLNPLAMFYFRYLPSTIVFRILGLLCILAFRFYLYVLGFLHPLRLYPVTDEVESP